MIPKEKRLCLNPKCENTFEPTWHTQKYCSPECRISNTTNYGYSRVNTPYVLERVGRYSRSEYICECGSTMKIEYDETGNLFLICKRAYCRNKIDFDKYLINERNDKRFKREVVE